MWKGGTSLNLKRKDSLTLSRIFLAFLLLTVLLIALVFTFSNRRSYGNHDRQARLQRLFSLSPLADNVNYKVKFRRNIDKGATHNVQFYVEFAGKISQQQVMAVAQKIVKDTISHENCHSISLDMGPIGYVDFAPFGNRNKAGEKPIEEYRQYRFKYIFFDSLARYPTQPMIR